MKTRRVKGQSKQRMEYFTKLKEQDNYETKRLENIKRNQEMLQSLGIINIVEDVKASSIPSVRMLNTKKRSQKGTKTKKEKKVYVARNSARLQGLDPAPLPLPSEIVAVEVNNEKLEKLGLLECEEYFKRQNIPLDKEAFVDGHYCGWVSQECIEKFGIESTEELWAEKVKNKTKSKVKTKLGSWSHAKSQAARQLQANPNAYFYRHCAPGCAQWTGEWTDEEFDLFVETARKYGCGDRWGLFSTHIPHRVGYQCSNFYRQFILPAGKIVDPNYKMTHDGRAIYCGNGSKEEK